MRYNIEQWINPKSEIAHAYANLYEPGTSSKTLKRGKQGASGSNMFTVGPEFQDYGKWVHESACKFVNNTFFF